MTLANFNNGIMGTCEKIREVRYNRQGIGNIGRGNVGYGWSSQNYGGTKKMRATRGKGRIIGESVSEKGKLESMRNTQP